MNISTKHNIGDVVYFIPYQNDGFWPFGDQPYKVIIQQIDICCQGDGTTLIEYTTLQLDTPNAQSVKHYEEMFSANASDAITMLNEKKSQDISSIEAATNALIQKFVDAQT